MSLPLAIPQWPDPAAADPRVQAAITAWRDARSHRQAAENDLAGAFSPSIAVRFHAEAQGRRAAAAEAAAARDLDAAVADFRCRAGTS